MQSSNKNTQQSQPQPHPETHPQPQKTSNKHQTPRNICFVGDSKTGKSSIIKHLKGKQFSSQYQETITSQFQQLLEQNQNQNQKIEIFLWSLSGSEMAKFVIPTYIRNSNLLVYVFDVNNRQSFENLRKVWLKKEHPEDLPFNKMLLGTKIDIQNKREVGKEEAEGIAKQQGMEYIEVSVKQLTNTKEMRIKLLQGCQKCPGVSNFQNEEEVDYGDS